MNGLNLRRIYESKGPRFTCDLISEGIKEGKFKTENFSLLELAEAFMGRDWVDNLNPRRKRGGVVLLEAGDAVDSTAFTNITGQLFFSTVMQGFKTQGLIGDMLARTIPTSLSGKEKIPGLGQLPTDGEVVAEGMPYPHAGFGEDYIETPAKEKRGLITGITREMIFDDRTGLVLDRARSVGERLAMNKEKRIIDLFIGATNSYIWKGTAYNTYQTTTPWINDLTGSANALVDWKNVETAELTLLDMTDPDTGDPIVIGGTKMVVPPALKWTANYVGNATEVRTVTNTNTTTIARSPNSGLPTEIISSSMLKVRLKAMDATNFNKYWFYGDPQAAFAYFENWALEVLIEPPKAPSEFERDIVVRYKATEKGVPGVTQPRAIVRIKGA